MSVNKKFDRITRDDLIEVADRFGIRKAEDSISDVRAAIGNWPEFAQKANLPSALQTRVGKDLLAL